MHRVCISRRVLGEPFDLCVMGKELRRSDGIPPDCWVFGDPDAELNLELLSILSRMSIRRVPERFTKAFAALGHTGPIRWQHALPRVEFDAFLAEMLEDIRSLLDRGCVAYYTEVFRRTREGLRALGRARVDKVRLDRYWLNEPNETNRSALRSLDPQSDGLAAPVVYSQTSTVSGRLIVESGPRILTLPRKYRDVIVSRFKGGKIVSIDFSSLEPRLILVAQGRPAPEDIYAEVCDSVFGGSLTRLQAKAVIISLLYGASEATISRASGLKNGELKAAIEGVSSFFGLDAFHERLLEEAKLTGSIRNYFGRPLTIGDRRNLGNLYAQSSAVDYALLGFSGAIEMIRERQLDIIPLFNIHDDLLLDVHPDHERYLDEIGVRCGQVAGVNEVFPVRRKEIGSV